MIQHIYCANCETIREMDRHGRCSCCQSEAIDIPCRPAKVETPTIADLEKLVEVSA